MLMHSAPRSQDTRESGFTLIELLVVVVILGILIAIAIPVYLNYRRSANDTAAQSDLRGAVSTLEQCFGDNNVYPARTDFTTGSTAGTNGNVCSGRPGKVSTGTTLVYYAAADSASYIVGSTNAGGSGKNYCYQSLQAGQVKQVNAAVSAFALSC